jgi:large subunit ribosomal protein L4e
MKTNVYSADGQVKAEIDLPEVFSTEQRPDLIRRYFRAVSLSARQPYGSSPTAGMRRVGHNAGPGHGTARIPRTSGSNTAVLLASFVKGKSAHSPRTTKILEKRMNAKERSLARKSAIALTSSIDAVRARGHIVPDGVTLPVVVSDDSLSKIKKAKEALYFLASVNLWDDVIRSKKSVKVRAGRGKMRGRTYKQAKSVLIVGTSKSDLEIFSSLPGVDTATVDGLSIRKLAPGGVGGRLTVYTESAIEKLSEVK